MAEAKKKYYDELNIFRALIIVWVVIGHSFDSGENVLGSLHEYAYSFHMWAFFALSGLLFAGKIKRSKSIKAKTVEIKNRACRLLVPYMFFTLVSYALKMFFEKYAVNALTTNPVVDILLCRNNPNGGIWFLYTLFFISAFALLLSNIDSRIIFGITIVLRIVNFFYMTNIPAIDGICEYSVFFFAGVLISDVYPSIENITSGVQKIFSATKSRTVYCVALVLTIGMSFALVYLNAFKLKSDVVRLAICVFNIILWYFTAQTINNIPSFKKIAMTIGDYGMDIYMIGYYVQIVIRVLCGSMLHIPYIVYSIMMCVFGLILPIPLSKFIVRKIGIARMLMLGDFSKSRKD